MAPEGWKSWPKPRWQENEVELDQTISSVATESQLGNRLTGTATAASIESEIFCLPLDVQEEVKRTSQADEIQQAKQIFSDLFKT